MAKPSSSIPPQKIASHTQSSQSSSIFIAASSPQPAPPSSPTKSTSGSFMLGLRPRPQLRPRNSLIDLIARHQEHQEHHKSIRSPPRSVPTARSISYPDPEELVNVAAAVPLPITPIDTDFGLFPKAPETPETTPVTQKISSKPIIKMPRKQAEAAEEHYGAVYSVSGPVIVAENMLGCAMYELVRVEHPRISIPR